MRASEAIEPPVAEQTYRLLRSAIVRCEFEPGDRLRVEDLTRRFGVSNSPIREALNRLSEQGLVRAVENRGFRVAALTADGVADLVRVRQLVEMEALRDSMKHGDDAWEASVVAASHALSLLERRLGDEPRALHDEWSMRHRVFHLSLYGACTSALLLGMVGDLFDNAERYRRWTSKYRQEPRRKDHEHQRLMDAVLLRDADKALELLGKHIGRTGQLVASVLHGQAASGSSEQRRERQKASA